MFILLFWEHWHCFDPVKMNWLLQVLRVTNMNFLLTISSHYQERRLWEVIKWSWRGRFFDLLLDSLHLLFQEMYRDHCGEFVCGYRGRKGIEPRSAELCLRLIWRTCVFFYLFLNFHQGKNVYNPPPIS